MDKKFNRGKGVEAKKRKTRVKQGKRKKENQVAHGCPTPLKIPHESFESAVYTITRRGNAGKGWGVYECICGWWHVTSRPGRLLRHFDDEFYMSDAYTYVPYNRATYRENKRAWSKKKGTQD